MRFRIPGLGFRVSRVEGIRAMMQNQADKTIENQREVGYKYGFLGVRF